MKRFGNTTGQLLCIAAATLIVHGSCVDNGFVPEAEPIAWIEIPVPRSAHDLDVLSLVSNGHGLIYYGAEKGQNIWRSADRGETWNEMGPGLNPHCDVVALLATGEKKIFAGLSGGGIFLSLDNGDTWTQVNNHLTDLDIRSMTLNSGGEIIVATDNGRIFRSAKDGCLWNQVIEEPIETPVSALATDSTGILYAGCLGQGVFVSENGGESWTENSAGLENPDIRCLSVHGEGYILAGADGGRIYRSPGGGSPWVRIDRGATEADIYAISTDPSGTIFTGTNGEGIIRSRDGGDSWERADNGLQGLEIRSLLCEEDVLLAGTVYYGVFRSIDGGGSWNGPVEFESDRFHYRQNLSFAIDTHDNYYLLNLADILKSSDRGESWVRACHGISNTYYPNTKLHCLAAHPNGSLFSGTEEGIFISTDYGNRWSRADTFSTDPPDIHGIEVAVNGMIFVRAADGILRSDAGGASWEYVYEDQPISCISTGSDSCVYLGTGHGIMRSTDYGETWERVTDSLRVYSIDADRVGMVIAICIEGILRSRDRGDSWTTIPVEHPPPEHSVISAPGGEVAIILDYMGNMYLSDDCFSSWTLIHTPFYVPIPHFGPDGYLFIISIRHTSLYRSGHPLF